MMLVMMMMMTTTMIMITSMGRDYVSELRPPTGLFFMSLATYRHGEPRWNDIDANLWYSGKHANQQNTEGDC
jgi:hypothetical protein